MSETAIRVAKLGKQYRIGQPAKRYYTLRESLTHLTRVPGRWLRRLQRGNSNAMKEATFWALRDVSFEVCRGEVVGIIGRNGAGKSTLLKILSRITEPTEGEADLYGRVGSLLEVGTGFHPELTGRENIFLNGAILGMKRSEIARKFDQIVAFAEVEQFMDTPVKHYSTGMYMRLAFGIAAHLEPEILLVDEVLAVGDAAFQQKCLGKMQDIAAHGRTVFLVSHQMAAIEHLCTTCILLTNGQIEMAGNPKSVIGRFLSAQGRINGDLKGRTDRQGTQELEVTAIDIFPLSGHPGDALCSGADTVIRIKYRNHLKETGWGVEITVGIYDAFARAITFLSNGAMNSDLMAREGEGSWECVIPRLSLVPGGYHINYQVHSSRGLLDWMQCAVSFRVAEGDFFGTGKLTFAKLGGVFLDHSWR